MSHLDPTKYAVAWIAPLEIEARAALHMLDERHQGRFQVSRGDDYVYHAGAMGGHNVIIATLPAGQKYGTGSAAALAGQLKKFFPNLWFGLLVGVAAGLPDLSRDPARDIRLGDVLVGLPEGESAGLIAYDLGKETEDGFQPLRRGHGLATTEPIVRSAIGSIKIEAPHDTEKFLPYYEKIRDKEHATGTFSDPGQELDVLFSLDNDGSEITTERDRRPDSRRIRAWYGPIGSGEKLWKNLRKRNELRDKYGLIGLEMEAAGTMDQIPVGVIRGVCDYGDGHKTKLWHPYAAAMAAAYARALLEEIPVRAPTQSEVMQAQLRVEGSFRQSKRPETPSTPSILIPFGRDRDFVKRGYILEKIEHSCGRPGSRTALVGLGGVGKSQLVIEYAYRTRERSPATWVFWVHASNSARFKEGFQDIATFVKVPGRQNLKASIFQLVHDWLQHERNGRWVIILDNVDDASFLKQSRSDIEGEAIESASLKPLIAYIPYCQHGSVLVTSRNKGAALELVEEVNIIVIEPMNEKDAMRLFQNKLGQIDDEACTMELAAALEYMPLAIVQAAAYVVQRRPRYSVQKYLDEFRYSDKRKADLLSLKGGELRRDTEAKNSILVTWQISFDYIRENRPSAADLLSLMSFCDRQGIPDILLRGQIDYAGGDHERDQCGVEYHFGVRHEPNDSADGTDSTDGSNDSDLEEQQSNYSDIDKFENDVLTLRNFSFIIAREDGAAFEMHRLVQLATLEWLKAQDTYDHWQHQFLTRLCAELPGGDYENWSKCQVLFPHAQSVRAQRPATDESIKEWATILYRAAWFAVRNGRGEEAEELSVQALKARKRIFVKDHEDVIASKAMVASAYRLRGRWSEGERLEVQVMEVRKTKLGENHPDTLTSMNNLAYTFINQGRWAEARKIGVQVMETSKIKLGEDHPITLGSMNNLSVTFMSQGRWAEAQKLSMQVIEMIKIKLGDDHPDTLTSMANLALTFWKQRRWEEAERLEVQIIQACKMKLGEDHPDTLTSISNLATTLMNQGQWVEAEKLNLQVIETSKVKLGEDHPDTLTSMANLATIFMNQCRWAEAEKLYVQVIETIQIKLGEDHPYMLTSMANLALMFWKQRRWKEAEKLEVQVLETRMTKLGENHPETLMSMHNLAYTFKSLGRQQEATELMGRCAPLRCRVLGPQHPDSTSSTRALKLWQNGG
ncbi:hypothetical protein NLG97_g1956 [Lecanicillium saksenae]|uniref:Uncharacterized protein n=1 Tax=Lecanicillium saksenae TaxID=468837 RepID=A0ACC1R6C4_9HYPO|nr:hypothetical protein NLG97_g1956 [Lecanicillium saksenae]